VTPCAWEAFVRHFARQGVLDDVLALTCNARARAPANEVAILEYLQIGLRIQELVHRPRPEDAPDHRRRLKRGLLGGTEQIDPGCKNGLDRVRDSEFARKLVQHPTAVLADEEATIEQHAEQLLDEEGIALGPLNDHLTQLGRQTTSEQLVEHSDAVTRRERLQLEQLSAGARAPARSAFEKLGPRRHDHKQRPVGRAEHVLEKIQKLALRPVNILDQ
jgi:hypothetical protein